MGLATTAKGAALMHPFEVTSVEDPNDANAMWSLVSWNATSIEGLSVVLNLSGSPIPFSFKTVMAVRYAWMDYAECVLENSAGLLASPFRAANRKASSNKPPGRQKHAGRCIKDSATTATTATNFQLECPQLGDNFSK
jgi:hypothetical protein